MEKIMPIVPIHATERNQMCFPPDTVIGLYSDFSFFDRQTRAPFEDADKLFSAT